MESGRRWWNCSAGSSTRRALFPASCTDLHLQSTGVVEHARMGTSCSCPHSGFSHVNSNLFGQPSASLMLCRNVCLSPQLPHSHSTKKTCIVGFPPCPSAERRRTFYP